jgi:hypothetical protein
MRGRTYEKGEWREEENKEKKVKQQSKEKRARKIDIERKKKVEEKREMRISVRKPNFFCFQRTHSQKFEKHLGIEKCKYAVWKGISLRSCFSAETVIYCIIQYNEIKTEWDL